MTTPLTWQEEFDEEFHFNDADNDINLAGTELARQLKDFIERLLERETAKAEERGKAYVFNYIKSHAETGHVEINGEKEVRYIFGRKILRDALNDTPPV